ncbi:hypothetical protein [uncultured Aquimarina sp.]|uniref:hypothetical protein n=1 Tax=uncultured Aquimarina sp. TaxID=575652 RepID=UPI0026335844|nr:hypothetical protein [uncultured Aquimarina sp.]
MKVPIEQIEFKDQVSTFEVGAMYKGQPFSGTAYGHNVYEHYYDWHDKDDDNVYYEWSYQNGRAHGRWCQLKQNSGEIIFNGFYKDGNKIGVHEEIRPPFKMVTEYIDGELIQKEIRNVKGMLLLEYNKKNNIDREYYDDGTLYRNTVVIDGRMYGSFYLGDEQNWLSKEIVKEKEYEYSGAPYRYNRLYNKPLLFSKIHSLEAKFHLVTLDSFCEFIIENNKKEATLYFKEMMGHNDLCIQNIGAYYAGELKDTDLIPDLKELIANKKKEPKRLILTNRFGELDRGYKEFHRTSKVAKEALKKINNVVNAK